MQKQTRKRKEKQVTGNSKDGMEAIKRNLWSRGIGARDVSRLNTGYDLLVEGFWKVGCKSLKYKTGGYMLSNINYLKFDVLAIALSQPITGKYLIYYLKSKDDLGNMATVEGTSIDNVYLSKEKIELYFTKRPEDVFIKI